MSPNSFNQSLVSVLLSLACAAQAEAQSSLGVRANGMGGAFVGVADDASAVYWNPAGLATGAVVSLNLELGGLEPAGGSERTLKHALVAFSLPLLGVAYYRQGTFGVGAPEAVVTDARSREEVRSRVHPFTTSTVAVSLLQSLTEHIVVSATPKVVWGGDSVRPDVDVSAMVAADRFRVGLVARHLASPSFDLGDTGDGEVELEPHVRLGGGWGSGWPGYSRVVVAVDGNVTERATPSGERRDVAAGVETWWLARRLGVRGGVRGSTVGDSRAVVSAGASALVAGFYVEGYFARGQAEEQSWSLGLRYSF